MSNHRARRVERTNALRAAAKGELADLAETQMERSNERILRENLVEIAEALGLPPKRPTRQTRAVDTPEQFGASTVAQPWRRRFAMAVVGLGICILAVDLAGRLSPPRPAPLPAELLGDWITKNPAYAGRRLGFAPGEVFIGVGDGGAPTPHAIRSVRMHSDRGATDLDLTYEAEGGPVELRATLTGRTRLEFSRPEGLVWERPVDIAVSR